MNRGVLQLEQIESEELLKNMDLDRHQGTPLFSKLTALSNETSDYKILLSEDELETIMDEIGPVDESINPQLSHAMQKIMELMTSFRN